MRGQPFHAERIVDGDASTLTALTLFKSGNAGDDTFELAANQHLVVTDVYIQTEAGGDFALVADSAAAGRYIAFGNVAANGGVVMHLNTPYTCPKGVTPKFQGPTTNRTACIVHGWVQDA